MRSIRSHAIAVIAYLLVGALINIAIAWGIAWRVGAPNNNGRPNPMRQGFTMTDGAAPLRTTLSDWSTHIYGRQITKTGTRLFTMTMVKNPGPTAGRLESVLPPTCGIDDVILREQQCFDDGIELGFYYWDGRGWPFISMSSYWPWFQVDQWLTPPIASGIEFGSSTTTHPWVYNVHDLRALPLRPVWPGFAINTLIYALLAWCISLGPLRLRRELRLRRGQCPKCGYPAGQSSVCTECGRLLPAELMSRRSP